MFQSHAGSIEATDFISTYVVFIVAFQSHAGSIEAGLRLLSEDLEVLFQSHAGSIEAGGQLLKRANDPPQFQSHAGSIEAKKY